MKANELRVTNFVLNDRVVNSVLFIGFDSVELITRQKNTITARLDLIQPIELTEDWLKKFGFTFACPYGDHIFNEYRKGVLQLLITPNGYEIFQIFRFIQIKHVHQLQNLYFALTGEELTDEL